jgi:hypothetical protein
VVYKTLDDDISEYVKHTEWMYNMRKAHTTPWNNSLGQTTPAIHYWDIRIIWRGIRTKDDPVLDYYLSRSSVDKSRFDKTLTVPACIHQLKNVRSQHKDVLKDTHSNRSLRSGSHNGTGRKEVPSPHLTEDNVAYAIEREEKIQM